MKRNSPVFTASTSRLFFAACTALVFFAACSKPHPVTPPPLNDSATLCHIESVLADDRGLPYGDTAAPTPVTFTYNSKGNPTAMIYPAGIVSFSYDSKDRLTAAISRSTGTPANGTRSMYSYPATNTIIDSVFVSQSDTANPNLPAPIYFTDQMELDASGRVVRNVRSFPGTTRSDTTLYVYDANGNWQYGSIPATYDTKVNPYRTSKTWQLLYKDYSRNNQYNGTYAGPAAYNANGLPTKFTGPLNTAPFFPYFATMDITYACDAPTPPHGY